MSARDFEPAMLILSRAVYAKRQDDCFYPGTLESRLPDGSYLVDFADGGKERVEESEITWLGFWGLPPWMWPRNPVVHTANPTANLQSLEEQFRNISSKEHPVNSVPFRALFREADETTKRFDGFSKTGLKLGASDVNEYRRPKMNRNSQDVIPPRVSPSPASENQTRTSVIRICHNGSLRDEDSKSEKNLTSTENTFESPAFRPSFHSNDERGLHFDEHKTVLQNVNSDSLVKKRRLSSPDYEECSIKEKCTRSEHMENRHRNSSPFQKRYTTSPPLPPFVSPHFEDYGQHSFGLSMYESTSPQRPVSFRLQNRARRRSENKKCRKVYGIENRDIWCTQCKWKKACTRFAATEKGDRTGLMYLTDYERLHLSV